MSFTVVQDVNSIFPYNGWCKPFLFLLAVANIPQSSEECLHVVCKNSCLTKKVGVVMQKFSYA